MAQEEDEIKILTKPEARFLTSTAMAKVLGLSSNAIISDKDIPVAGRKGNRRYYDEFAVIKFYLDRVRSGAQQNTVASKKLTLVEQQERKLKLQNDLAEGITCKIDLLIEMLMDYSIGFRAGLEAAKGRLAQPLSGKLKPSEVRAILEKEFDEICALAEQAFQRDAKFARRYNERRRQIATGGSSKPNTTAPKKVSRRMGGRKSGAAKR